MLEKVQKKILDLTAKQYPKVYLVGGTAISLIYHHRVSEDLDFFMQTYASNLHKDMAGFIRKKTGFKFKLVEEEKRKKYIPMAVYEFEIGKKLVLKIDFMKDFTKLLQPRQKSGIASTEDIYYRKMLAAIGWKSSKTQTGRVVTGGRQKTKDLYDIFFLSTRVERLSVWFPRYFDLFAYERLSAWYLSISKQKAVSELLELVPDCDAKAVFRHLDDEIIQKLNQKYLEI